MNNFIHGIGAQRKVAPASAKQAAQKRKVTVQEDRFQYKVNSHVYTAECVQLACYEYCLNKRGINETAFCNEACVASECTTIKKRA